MATIKPFKGLRPPVKLASRMASLPYDVMCKSEAMAFCVDNAYSLLHITRSEIDCDDAIDDHSPMVYQKSAENFNRFIESGWLVQDDKEHFYIYAQTMNGRTQYGVVACTPCVDYMNGTIKKHELTRVDKEDDRVKHITATNANVEPVFLSYKAVEDIDSVVREYVNNHQPIYKFIAEDKVEHCFWVIVDSDVNIKIEQLFAQKVLCAYVADGHHRTAAAARVGMERQQSNANHSGNEAYNYFMAVFFPDNQLEIFDYNRLVTDLNGLNPRQLLMRIDKWFDIECKPGEIFKPNAIHQIGMYMGGQWYKLTARNDAYCDSDSIGVLDVSILSEKILDQILGIQDLRTSKRIDFVGGIRGLEPLMERVDSGEMAVAFALYPVTMQQLINIADNGEIMPPKSTWFEPKLRSGLVVHLLE